MTINNLIFSWKKKHFFNKSDYFDEVLFRMCEVV